MFQHEKQDKTQIDIELGLDSSEEDSKEFDLFIPPTNNDSRSTSCVASPLTVMEEKTTISPINLPTLPPIDEKDLESGRNRAIADSRSKRTRSHVSMFDSFIETSSVSTSNSDTNRNTVVHEFVPDGTEPDQGKNASPSITTNISTNKRKDKETQTLKVSTATRSKIEHISDVYASFNLPKSTRSCIPSIKDLRNEEVLNEINANKWRGLINMSQKCLDQTLRAICLGPSCTQLKLDLVKDVQRKEKVSNSKHKTEKDFEKINNKIMHALFTMLKNSKNASIEKKGNTCYCGQNFEKRNDTRKMQYVWNYGYHIRFNCT